MQQQNAPPDGQHPPFRVLMLGASGVGKTALTAQFMTSEYLNAYEASLGNSVSFHSRLLEIIVTADAHAMNSII